MANPEGNNEKFGRPLRELAGTGAAQVNVLIVTHKTNIVDEFGKAYADVQEGEALIFRPTPSGPNLAGRGKRMNGRSCRAASVPNPKFALLRSTLGSELRIR